MLPEQPPSQVPGKQDRSYAFSTMMEENGGSKCPLPLSLVRRLVMSTAQRPSGGSEVGLLTPSSSQPSYRTAFLQLRKGTFICLYIFYGCRRTAEWSNRSRDNGSQRYKDAKSVPLYGRQNVDSMALTTIFGLYASQAFCSLDFSVAGTPRLSVAIFQASQTHFSTVPFFLLCNVLCLDANAVTLLLIGTSF